ncbi:hypothetical protein ABT255_07795 [Streptomyces mirabilis]|uniref:hypothetical protein n=1 Tax=Streptomyces mirabilis TaxID=68239 RepID=UPI00331D3FDA
MTAWWMALIQFGSSGALGATGVVVGQRVLARREDTRWVRETQREDQRWEREDRHRWTGERQRVFTEYLGLVSTWRPYVRHLRHSPDGHEAPTPDPRTFTHDAERLIAEMELLGSRKVAVAARALWMWFGASSVCLPEQSRSNENKNSFTQGLEVAYQELMLAMRHDLGIGSADLPAHTGDMVRAPT